ncbi:MAG: protein kinase [Limnothrix sp. RL_2_0]|nr:protein kinase [Limnothrix sp. RL_2_0]
MVYCLNPQCPKPFNPETTKFCVHCGSKLSLGDRYEGVKLIQQGLKGRTILGIDKGTNPVSYCIIKQATVTDSVIPHEFLAAFRLNVQQLARLGDRREFPTILETFIPSNLADLSMLPTVVFEKIEGESLLQKFNYSGRFSEVQAKEFLLEILPLLQIMSDYQIVHRDLSPANLIFTPDKYWAIVDFSAAKVTSKMANVKEGTLVGSGIYTAPEQLRGKSYPASDLYSLGIICLELLTMMHPFELYSSLEGEWVWQDYLKTPVSPDFAALLNQMVAETVGDRPRNAKAVLKVLKGDSTSQPVASRKSVKSMPRIDISFGSIAPIRAKSTASSGKWHCFKTLRGHSGYISNLSFEKTGKFLASTSADQTIRIWNVEYRFEIRCLRGHKGIVSAALFVGAKLISGSWDYTIRLWDWRNGTEGDRLEQHSSWIQDLATIEDGHKLAVLSADKKLTLWDLNTHKNLKNWDANDSNLLHSDAKSPVLISANQNDILLWQQEKLLCQFSGHFGQIEAVKISPNGKFMVSAANDNTLMLWSVLEQKCDKVFQTKDPVKALAIFPDKRFFAAGDNAGTLHIWQLGQENPLVSLPGHEGAIQAIAVSPDSKIIATGSQDKTIKLWRFGIQ